MMPSHVLRVSRRGACSDRGSTRSCSRRGAWSALADSFRGLPRSTTRRKSPDGASCRSPIRISYAVSHREDAPSAPPRLGHSGASISIVRRLMQLILWFWPRILAFGCSPYLGCPADTLVCDPTRRSRDAGRHAKSCWGRARASTPIDAKAVYLQQFLASEIRERSAYS